MKARMKLGDYLVEYLRRIGVSHLFGISDDLVINIVFPRAAGSFGSVGYLECGFDVFEDRAIALEVMACRRFEIQENSPSLCEAP